LLPVKPEVAAGLPDGTPEALAGIERIRERTVIHAMNAKINIETEDFSFILFFIILNSPYFYISFNFYFLIFNY